MGARKKKSHKNAGKTKAKRASGVVSKSLECTIKVVSVEGSSSGDSKFALTPGCTAGDALKKQGISASRKILQIDGKPADLTTPLTAGCTLTVEERAQGS